MQGTRTQGIPDWLMALLRCPVCTQPALRRRAWTGLECEACGHQPPLQAGLLDLTAGLGGPPRLDRPYEGFSGKAYATFMDHLWMQHLDSWLLGMRAEDYHERMVEQLSALPPGPSLDIPSGGSPFLGIVPGYMQGGPWLLADLSWTMLRHAQRKCEALGLREVVLIRADACRLPLRSRGLLNIVSLFGFHCFHDKAAVFAEMSRCLMPQGRLLASTLTSDGPLGSRLYLKLNQRDGTFAANNSLHEIGEQAQRQLLKMNVLSRLGAAVILEMRHGA